MLRKEKEQIVNDLSENLVNSTVVIATDYRGLTAKEMVQLRQRLAENDIEYKVAKNTLTRFAAEKAGKGQLKDLLTGPIALGFGYSDDITRSAKVFAEYIRSSKAMLEIKGGLLDDKLLTPEDISNLANIPSKDVLVSQLIRQLWAPIQTLHNVLSSPLQGFSNVIQARIQQIEGGQSV